MEEHIGEERTNELGPTSDEVIQHYRGLLAKVVANAHVHPQASIVAMCALLLDARLDKMSQNICHELDCVYDVLEAVNSAIRGGGDT